MLQPEILLALLKQYAARVDGPTILDAWSSYFDAHGVPPGNLLDRAAYHANLRGITPMEVWNGNIISPSISFVSAFPGFAFNADNITGLWQDTAGETPVTAAGQTVARIDDLSGQGNHAIQADPAKQPTYLLDTDNRGYLQFDGVDDFLEIPLLGLSGQAQAIVLAAYHRDNLQSDNLLAPVPRLSAANMSAVRLGGNLTVFWNGPTPTATQVGEVLEDSAAVSRPTLLSFQLDAASADAEGVVTSPRINRGAAVSFGAVGTQTAAVSFGSSAFQIGIGDGVSQAYQGKFYGAVLRTGDVSATTQLQLENAFASITF